MSNRLLTVDHSCEWLQSNHLGSFSMGSIDRIPRRKYHSLLVLRESGVGNGERSGGDPFSTLVEVGEHLEVGSTLFMFYNFNFGERTEPKGYQHLQEFSPNPHPRWRYQLNPIQVDRELQLDPDRDIVRLYYSVRGVTEPIRFYLRPHLACRSMHGLTQENPFLNGLVREESQGIFSIQPYSSTPKLYMRVKGVPAKFITQGEWVKKIVYTMEVERGYDAMEDVYAPGSFELEIKEDGEFVFEFGADSLTEDKPRAKAPMSGIAKPLTPLAAADRSGRPKIPNGYPSFQAGLEEAAEKYLLTTRKGFHSIIAGFPWFGHWGRDSFISLPGLCLATGNYKAAEKILESYGEFLLESLKKHGFVFTSPEHGITMTGMDTPFLYIYAVQKLREFAPRSKHARFMPTVCGILNALKNGADPRVRVTDDGGLFIQRGHWTVSWMDVMMDGAPVTPRTGFAVDLNALFYNAARFAMEWAKIHDQAFVKDWSPILQNAERSFLTRFWSDESARRGYLADCHDGSVPDFSLRPNQLWAFALSYSPLYPVFREVGERVLETVRRSLVTPVGLRTLAPTDSRYRGQYRGGHRERDLAYHQGTVWPWLIGIYADAVGKVEGQEKMREELQPLLERLAHHFEKEGCLGQISEVFDGNAPHLYGGTPAQAWSVAEVLRVVKKVNES